MRVLLTSALVGDEFSASRPGGFTPQEGAPSIHLTGGWMGPGTSLDDGERKKPCPYRDSNSNPSAVQPVSSRYTRYVISAPNNLCINFYLTLYSTNHVFSL
jgi:hypothetical protein